MTTASVNFYAPLLINCMQPVEYDKTYLETAPTKLYENMEMVRKYLVIYCCKNTL